MGQVSKTFCFLTLSSGLSRSGTDTVNSVHLTEISVCSPTAQQFQSTQIEAAPPTDHTFRAYLDRQQLLTISLVVSLLLLPLPCGEWEVDTSAPAMSPPNLSSPCLGLGLLALPLLCKAHQGHQESFLHKFQWLFLQPLPAGQAENFSAGDYILLPNFSTSLISLPCYQASLSSIWPFLYLLLHGFGCPQSSLFLILWQLIHTPRSYLELDYCFLINVSGLCLNFLFLTAGKQTPVLGRARTLHSTHNSWWSWQNPSPGTLQEQVYPGLPWSYSSFSVVHPW